MALQCVQCTHGITVCTVYTWHYSVYSVHTALQCTQCTHGITVCIVYTRHYSVYSVYSIHVAFQCVQCTHGITVYSVHMALQPSSHVQRLSLNSPVSPIELRNTSPSYLYISPHSQQIHVSDQLNFSTPCSVYISFPCLIFHCVLCFYCLFYLPIQHVWLQLNKRLLLQSLSYHLLLGLVQVSTPLQIINRCCLGFP